MADIDNLYISRVYFDGINIPTSRPNIHSTTVTSQWLDRKFNVVWIILEYWFLNPNELL